jgi:hypothetical protein
MCSSIEKDSLKFVTFWQFWIVPRAWEGVGVGGVSILKFIIHVYLAISIFHTKFEKNLEW